jgi:hypothetical protein
VAQQQPSQRPPQGTVLRQTAELNVTQHQGPIPSPATLREYDGLITNGANRIMAMAESEQGHRHRMEGLVVMTSVAAQVIGTVAATGVALAFILMAFWLFREGKNGAAFVSMLAPLAGLCGVIVWRVRKKPGE